jgi:hypothetical protein
MMLDDSLGFNRKAQKVLQRLDIDRVGRVLMMEDDPR